MQNLGREGLQVRSKGLDLFLDLFVSLCQKYYNL
jgi:hypothetical protein